MRDSDRSHDGNGAGLPPADHACGDLVVADLAEHDAERVGSREASFHALITRDGPSFERQEGAERGATTAGVDVEVPAPAPLVSRIDADRLRPGGTAESPASRGRSRNRSCVRSDATAASRRWS